MKLTFAALLSALAAGGGHAARDDGKITIEDFSKPGHTWKAQNDPVMGGQSYSTVTVVNNTLDFVGACEIVPFLNAPGFIKAEAGSEFGVRKLDMGADAPWADVSSCQGLEITGMADSDYAGFRISFGTAKPPQGKFFARGYKANYHPSVGTPSAVQLPFTNFTDFWDDATGDAIKTCADSKDYCPDQATLQNMKTFSFWAEGVEGHVHLTITSVSGYGCNSGLVAVL